MNWILLIVAGCFEVVFATCLGKAKESTGTDVYWWYGGFLLSLAISMLLLDRFYCGIKIDRAVKPKAPVPVPGGPFRYPG